MTARPAYCRFCMLAEKWLCLAEQRRAYFVDLHQSGRSRLYYTEEEFLARMRDIAGICDRWEGIVEKAWAIGHELMDQTIKRNAA